MPETVWGAPGRSRPLRPGIWPGIIVPGADGPASDAEHVAAEHPLDERADVGRELIKLFLVDVPVFIVAMDGNLRRLIALARDDTHVAGQRLGDQNALRHDHAG